MNLISFSDGHVDILRGIVHAELQRLLAQDLRGDEEMNYDRAAHLLIIYDQISDIASKWNGKLPQWGCTPMPPSEEYRPIKVATVSLPAYLARDGTLKNIPAVD